MTRFLVCLLFAAAVVAANPFVETYLSEVSVDSAHQFVELCCAPMPQSVDLSGWRIVTSLSACTLTYQLQYDEVLVVDSEALAIGDIGHGTFRLNPLGDSVFLFDDTGYVADHVHFPRYPTGHDSAPLPPATGSIAFWNFDDFEGQSMNWYIDSTPTPGWENDDHSMIAGSVTGTGGITLDEVMVVASGQSGRCHQGLMAETDYGVSGLGAGKYAVKAYAFHQGHSYQVTYPESVAVGYSQTVGGINIVIPLTGVAKDATGNASRLGLGQRGRTLVLSADRPGAALVTVYDNLGRVGMSEKVIMVSGSYELPLHLLSSGVYFASCRFRERTANAKFVLY